MKKFLLISLLASTVSLPAAALTADREKPIEIFANSFHGDEVKQTAVYTGNVELHQGTLDIRGNKLVLVVSNDGYRTVTVTGNPVRIKEKRDNPNPRIDEWMHASGKTAVYTERDDTIRLQGGAKVARSENGLVKDTSSGENIEYDMLTGHTKLTAASPTPDGGQQRISTQLAPSPKAQKSNAAPQAKPNTKASQPKKAQPKKSQPKKVAPKPLDLSVPNGSTMLR